MLVYNEFETSQDFLLEGCWSDVFGNLYTGVLSVAPYASKVLQREDATTCSLTTGVDELEVAHSSGLYPNPVREGEQVRLSEPVKEPTSALLMDMTGRLVQEVAMAAGASMLPVGQGVRPGSYAVVLRTASHQQSLRLVVE
jgi:hypothetical protein